MLTVLAVAAVLVLVLLWLGQRRLIYFPTQDVPAPATIGLKRVEEATLHTDDGIALGAWWVQARAARSGDATVIIFNGNGGNRAYRAALADALARLGLSALLFDYRGYGGNAGTPTEEGLAHDARAALAFARAREAATPKRIVYFGESLGAAVAVRLATEHPPAALILRSPFTSLAAVGQYHYPFLPVAWLLRDRYASIDRIRSIRCPLLVIAGARDSIVPADQSRALFDAANEPKRLVIVPGADHNDYEMLAGETILRAVVELLGGASGPSAIFNRGIG
jgi:fermentation-respiration switch protein FrsA (DUF1100 family)